MNLGLAPLTGPAGSLLFGVPRPVAGLVPWVTVAAAAAADVVLAGPRGFLSATLVCVLKVDKGSCSLLGIAPDVDATAADVVFFTVVLLVGSLVEGLTPFTVWLVEVPGRELGLEAPAVLVVPAVVPGCTLDEAPFGLALEYATAGLPLACWGTGGAVEFSGSCAFAVSSGCNGGGTCCVTSSCVAATSCVAAAWDKGGSASTMASVGSMFSMVTPSGFIP